MAIAPNTPNTPYITGTGISADRLTAGVLRADQIVQSTPILIYPVENGYKVQYNGREWVSQGDVDQLFEIVKLAVVATKLTG